MAIVWMAVALAGCANTMYNTTSPLSAAFPESFNCNDSPYNFENVIVRLDLKDVINKMAAELCAPVCANGCVTQDPMCANTTMLTTDFVDLVYLTPRSAGLFLSELMRNGMSNVCCYRVMQGEFGEHFKINQEGLVVLTRKPDELKQTEYPYSEAIVGTYKFTPGRLYLFARKINVYTGNIVKMSTREISYRCMGDNVIKSVR
ncbi:MAG: hypothetical protein HQK89_05525 [Nitrospirae bacterium]|nr:hypothetical protein [Nitrospirota bacterium]